jgi:hypothetical protein
MFAEVGVGLWAARFDDGDVEAGFGEALCGPAAGGAGADYEDVEICWGVGSGHLRGRRDRQGSDAGFYGMDASNWEESRQRKKMDFRGVKILLDVRGEWYHRRRNLLWAGRLGRSSAAPVHESNLTDAANGFGRSKRWWAEESDGN